MNSDVKKGHRRSKGRQKVCADIAGHYGRHPAGQSLVAVQTVLGH